MSTATEAPQNMTALANANRIRLAQCARRREITAAGARGGRLAVAELLDSPPEDVARMRLSFLLDSIHRFGPRWQANTLSRAGLRSPALDRRVGPCESLAYGGDRSLSERQRLALAAVLREVARA